MSYVIMNVGTERLHRKAGEYCDASYKTERAAKGACTRLNREYSGYEMQVANGKDVAQWVVMTYAEFDELHNPIVTVFSLMTGKPVQIRKSEKGGCTDPSTERYHCM